MSAVGLAGAGATRSRRPSGVFAALLVALAAGCSNVPVRPAAPQPFVRHVMFTSGDQAVAGDTMDVTSQLVNDGPGDVYWWHGPCDPPFVIAMGDTVRVWLADPRVPCAPADTDTVAAGRTVTEGLAFTGALWDSLGGAFQAPTGRYVVRRAVTYSRQSTWPAPLVGVRRRAGRHGSGGIRIRATGHEVTRATRTEARGLRRVVSPARRPRTRSRFTELYR